MRNRVLSLTRNVIPYVKELRIFTDSVVGCILMQQLDYWFERYPDGFYKFLEASDHPKYSAGQSWSEEIGISSTEFRTAFDKIGTRWKSKTEFENAEDKFQGKFYASYQDKRANLTFYFRNHELVDTALDQLLLELNKAKAPTGSEGQSNPNYKMANVNKAVVTTNTPQSTGAKDSSSPANDESESTVDANGIGAGDGADQPTVNTQHTSPELHISDSQEIDNPPLDNTEITITEITSDKLQLQETSQPTESTVGSGSALILFLPPSLSEPEQASLRSIVSGLDPAIAQNVLDEACGIRKAGQVKVSLISLTSGLVKKAQEGKFNLAAGLSIQRERERAKKEALTKQPQKQVSTGPKEYIPLNERLATAGVKLHGKPRINRI